MRGSARQITKVTPKKKTIPLPSLAWLTSCHPEVAHLRHAAPVPVIEEQDIRRLHVAVADPEPVQVGKAGRGLLQASAHCQHSKHTAYATARKKHGGVHGLWWHADCSGRFDSKEAAMMYGRAQPKRRLLLVKSTATNETKHG